MEMRRDALVGAAELITEVNHLARATPGLLGTVGTLSLAPGAVNAVAREVRLTIELRAPDDAMRISAGTNLTSLARQIAVAHGLRLEMTRSYQQAAVPCDPHLSERLEAALRETGGAGRHLPSGATHDASAMADLCPVAMLFVRCRNGVSHRPEEYASPEDMQAAISAITTLLSSYARSVYT